MSNTADTLTLTCSRCNGCGEVACPPASCALCGLETDKVEIETEGTLYSYTVVHRAPPGVAVPYAIGYADFVPGLRLFALVTPIDELTPGATVRLVPDCDVGYRFELIQELVS